MAEVIIYTTDYCPHCTKAKTLLKIKGTEFREIDVTHDDAPYQEMIKKSGGRQTVPQIFINNKHIGGCDDLYALNDKGGLDPLLAA